MSSPAPQRPPSRPRIGTSPLRGAAAALCLVLSLAALVPGGTAEGAPGRRAPVGAPRGAPPAGGVPPGWVRIDYGDLVERHATTHGGRTVGEILDALAGGERPTPSLLADLQPHLEPFSFALNDVAGASSPDGTAGWQDVSDRWPRGSRQPAWVALFREGRYRLFHKGGKVRLFLQGDGSPAALFRKERGVVRHPLLELLSATGRDRLSVEVHAFRNDYRGRSLLLAPAPFAAEVTRANLLPRRGVLPMHELVSFFSRAAALEGAEVDDGGNLFLYGRPGAPPTLAGSPATLADLAVVYRAVFHSGRNAPFVSLDRNEDNRLAKVNLGGLLEDTRVGSVVLEADKAFKTLATGLTPAEHRDVAEEIARQVPGFRTASVRTLDTGETGLATIRYWFYPDRVRTVTDGYLCAVESARFVADAERLDRKGRLSKAQADTIDHLNRHYDAYARALPPLRELDTVGRLMAVATWLHESGAPRKADLSALLGVEIPPFETPRRTRKIVAVAVGATASDGGPPERSYKLFLGDDAVDRLPPTATDVQLIEAATAKAGSSRDPALFPKSLREARAALEREAARINGMEAELRELEGRISAGGPGRLAPGAADGGSLLARFEAKKEEHRRAVEGYNRAVDRAGRFRLDFRTVGTASGGINLRPGAFAKPRREAPSSPLLSRLRGAGMMRSSARPAVYAPRPAAGAPPTASPSVPAARGGGKGGRGGSAPPAAKGGAAKRMGGTAAAPSPSVPRGVTVSEDAPDPAPLPSRPVSVPAIAAGREVPLSGRGGVVMSSQGGTVVLKRAR